MNRPSANPPAPTGARARRDGRGRGVAKVSVLGVLSCAVATAGLMVPVDAAVNPRHIISVLKDESTISAEGFATGETVRVQVKRRGVVVGSVEGRSDGTFEVNHDFCWDRFTPRILPGDVVAVRSRAGLDTVRIADIELTEGPTLGLGGDSFTIKGRVNGPRVPVGELVAEARTNDPIRFRPLAPNLNPDEDEVRGEISYDGAGGEFTATFTGMNAEQQEAFENLSEPSVQHAPAANEATIATGGEPVPGPGCTVDAPVVDQAVTAVSPQVISRRNAGSRLRVQGFARDAGSVEVRLRDRDGTTVLRPAVLAGTGFQTWTLRVPATAMRRLNGHVSVAAVVDGVRASVGMRMLRDLVAPEAPNASVRSGTYRRTQFVSLSAGRGERIRYTLGNGRQARPTRNRGTLYRGRQIRIASSQTLKMVAIDRAGNVSKVARRDYTIGR